ncbi:carbohydrate ABC transporter permease [Phototrophicus methaneseepsis]|uniref:Carbohydrate ABC transporter permease n=1 Tax=Phototrophicus methaneseepsis TaxID=2710758 RepID=A0A7S8EAR9_9CHLR|nr:carbohydrate ABC transporter permease [Phototrophicus methaneseepsis]QPC83378.1 carbohydrate ABC transporter permease [Phototrophicus methaneseepsis]
MSADSLYNPMIEQTVTPVRHRKRLLSGENLIVYIILTVGCLITLIPFIWTILASFKTHAEIINPAETTFLPREFTTENYETILSDETLPLGRFYFNSAFIAVGNVITLSITSSIFGYVFAKFNFRYKRALYVYILATMMIPFQLTMIPSYLILLEFNLTNNIIGMVALSWFDAFGIFLMRQFIASIPDDLLDAARVDGASEWRIYFRIVLPQIMPAMATYGTLVFISNWNAYLWPLIVLRDVDVRTLPIILTWYNDRHTSNLGLQMAASVLIVMPILVVYLFLQRWIVRGFTMSGLK